MKSIRRILPALLLAALTVSSGCRSHKKPKCNTCPKWEDRVDFTSQSEAHEEQYESGSRP